jgi:hypothetical protein
MEELLWQFIVLADYRLHNYTSSVAIRYQPGCFEHFFRIYIIHLVLRQLV